MVDGVGGDFSQTHSIIKTTLPIIYTYCYILGQTMGHREWSVALCSGRQDDRQSAGYTHRWPLSLTRLLAHRLKQTFFY